MGSVCCKPSAIDDSKESPKERFSSKTLLDLQVAGGTSSRREEAYRAKDRYDSNDGRTMLLDKQTNGFVAIHGNDIERKRKKMENVVAQYPGMGSVPKASEGEQIAAGWPSWLAAVAGEAIRGWVPRRADSFEKLDKIGRGTYSNVYKARDLDQKKIVALKKVRFDDLEPESVRFMVKCYMQQLLRGLDHCHSHGVLHCDIKGSNLLIDNNDILKIVDFGLESFFDPHQHQPLTSHVVTLWYRPPELLLGATYYGTVVDLWSTGCILAELYADKPIMLGRTKVEQLHKIFKLCASPSEDYWKKSKLPHATIFKPQQPYRRCVTETFKDFLALALSLMEILLSIDPVDRGSAASALKSEFYFYANVLQNVKFNTKQLIRKILGYELLSHEAITQEASNEYFSKQGAVGSKDQRFDPKRRGTRESRANPTPDANAELVLSMQVASSFPIDSPRPSQVVDVSIDSQSFNHKRTSHSGPLAHRAWAKATKNLDDGPKVSAEADLSTMSGLVAARRSLVSDERRERSGSS
ncbi:hypothetical protein FNV43_RR16816 [Rhamnella rubrinervis]|uniref:Protein kinase domain-containing protein n=1 Tax=Rhamnella rubrinervis TaxID=2594499 RepID=A0A8K0ME07_9ROSA|nr:hypothetical protein FNV43_RR16816 [Rhamnella rubrinervis]